MVLRIIKSSSLNPFLKSLLQSCLNHKKITAQLSLQFKKSPQYLRPFHKLANQLFLFYNFHLHYLFLPFCSASHVKLFIFNFLQKYLLLLPSLQKYFTKAKKHFSSFFFPIKKRHTKSSLLK